MTNEGWSVRTKIVACLIAVALAFGLAVVAGPGAVTRYKAHAAQGDRARNQQGPRPTAVVTAPVQTTDFPIMRYSTGFLSSPAVVNVGSRIASQITEIPVKDGQTVKAGDILFKLDDSALNAQLAKDQAGLAKDQAALVSAQADLDRAREILAKGAGTQQAYDEQLATTKGLEAAVEADQAAIRADKVQLGYATIVAATPGRLGTINASVGDLVGSGNGQSGTNTSTTQQSGSSSQPLVTITRMDPLRVTFTLPEADLGLLQSAIANPGQATVTLSSRDDGGGPLAQGALDFLDSSVDTTSGTIAARASVDNSAGKLWPGLYVNVAIRFGTLKDAVTVPTVALQTGQKGPYVFVVGADGKASMKTVTIAMSNDRQTAVSAGLNRGEKVVVEGQGRLKDGAPVTEDTGAARISEAALTETGK
ncbi:MAG: efflux RND transporter periplasmic adaptor subunit [Mesorhizobium sp.]